MCMQMTVCMSVHMSTNISVCMLVHRFAYKHVCTVALESRDVCASVCLSWSVGNNDVLGLTGWLCACSHACSHTHLRSVRVQGGRGRQEAGGGRQEAGGGTHVEHMSVHTSAQTSMLMPCTSVHTTCPCTHLHKHLCIYYAHVCTHLRGHVYTQAKGRPTM